jgi:hypothetical protein
MDHEKWLEQHDRMIGDHDRMIAECDRLSQQNARDLRAMHQTLRRAIAAGVCEARNERRKRAELDEKITRLASAHLLAEEETKALKASLKAYLDSLRRGGNGNQS